MIVENQYLEDIKKYGKKIIVDISQKKVIKCF